MFSASTSSIRRSNSVKRRRNTTIKRYFSRCFFRYVKRSLPFDAEHPRERFEATEELMIVINFEPSQTFLDELTNFFSSYGKIEDVRYKFAKNFRFVLLKFTDRGKKKRKTFRCQTKKIKRFFFQRFGRSNHSGQTTFLQRCSTWRDETHWK